MDSELRSTSQWIQFFRCAGLPANVAANYALIFFDNRIQQNMLMDISKEYLYDMGIKVMGDVIAILKYAKEYHNQLAKEKFMMEDDTPIISTSPTKRSTPASRVLERYTRPSQPQTITIQESPPPVKKVEKAKRKIISNVVPPTGKSSTSLIKKARRVFPEDEGSYTIRMPKGSTERTKKILEQSVKKSVFDRLGDSDVSSSTDVKATIMKSVFNRLGPATNEVSTSSVLLPDNNLVTYQGVLKNTAKKTVVRKVINPVLTQTASRSIVTTGNPSIVNRLGGKVSGSAKRIVINNPSQRLGVGHINKILKESTLSTPDFGNSRLVGQRTIQIQKKTAANVQSVANRLGAKSILRTGQVAVSNYGQKSAQSSVFQRLGK